VRPRHARRRDANEPDIVAAFRARGCSVTLLDGAGVPDLLVGRGGRTWLVEVKLPLGPKGGKSQRRECEGGSGDFTADQVTWWNTWKGEAPMVVRTVGDVERILAGFVQVCGMHGDDCDCAERRAS
jgi:hypothetical protein